MHQVFGRFVMIVATWLGFAMIGTCCAAESNKAQAWSFCILLVVVVALDIFLLVAPWPLLTDSSVK